MSGQRQICIAEDRTQGQQSRMADLQGLLERLEWAVSHLELLSTEFHRPPGHGGVGKSVSGGLAPSVEAFDKLRNSMVAEFLKNSRILAGDVETHVSTFLPCSQWSLNLPAQPLTTLNSLRRSLFVFLLWLGRWWLKHSFAHLFI